MVCELSPHSSTLFSDASHGWCLGGSSKTMSTAQIQGGKSMNRTSMQRADWSFMKRSLPAFETISRCVAELEEEPVQISSSLSPEQLETRRSFLKRQQKQMLGRDL